MSGVTVKERYNNQKSLISKYCHHCRKETDHKREHTLHELNVLMGFYTLGLYYLMGKTDPKTFDPIEDRCTTCHTRTDGRKS